MKKEDQLSYSALFIGTLSVLIILSAQFALHPINMAGGMTLPFPLTPLEINMPLVALLMLLLILVLVKSNYESAITWILLAASLVLFLIGFYFFTTTGVLEAREAKPDIDRYYPQDELNYVYIFSVVVLFSSLGLWNRKKQKTVSNYHIN